MAVGSQVAQGWLLAPSVSLFAARGSLLGRITQSQAQVEPIWAARLERSKSYRVTALMGLHNTTSGLRALRGPARAAEAASRVAEAASRGSRRAVAREPCCCAWVTTRRSAEAPQQGSDFLHNLALGGCVRSMSTGAQASELIGCIHRQLKSGLFRGRLTLAGLPPSQLPLASDADKRRLCSSPTTNWIRVGGFRAQTPPASQPEPESSSC